jgi:hypothetical protein
MYIVHPSSLAALHKISPKLPNDPEQHLHVPNMHALPVESRQGWAVTMWPYHSALIDRTRQLGSKLNGRRKPDDSGDIDIDRVSDLQNECYQPALICSSCTFRVVVGFPSNYARF